MAVGYRWVSTRFMLILAIWKNAARRYMCSKRGARAKSIQKLSKLDRICSRPVDIVLISDHNFGWEAGG